MYCNKRLPFLLSGFQADTSIYRITNNDQKLIMVTSVTPPWVLAETPKGWIRPDFNPNLYKDHTKYLLLFFFLKSI